MTPSISTFRRMEDPYLKERAADLEEIGRRLLSQLSLQTLESLAERALGESCGATIRMLISDVVGKAI